MNECCFEINCVLLLLLSPESRASLHQISAQRPYFRCRHVQLPITFPLEILNTQHTNFLWQKHTKWTLHINKAYLSLLLCHWKSVLSFTCAYFFALRLSFQQCLNASLNRCLSYTSAYFQVELRFLHDHFFPSQFLNGKYEIFSNMLYKVHNDKSTYQLKRAVQIDGAQKWVFGKTNGRIFLCIRSSSLN